MKASKVYRMAAEIIDRDQQWWCCNQIMHITGECPTTGQNVLRFAEYFRPPEKFSDWFGSDWDHRVMCLLLMSEISRSEE